MAQQESTLPTLGEQWPGEVEAYVQPTKESRGEPRTRIWLLCLFAGLLVALTVWAMVNGNQTIIDKVFELIRYGLSAGVGFEVGRAKFSQ